MCVSRRDFTTRLNPPSKRETGAGSKRTGARTQPGLSRLEKLDEYAAINDLVEAVGVYSAGVAAGITVMHIEAAATVEGVGLLATSEGVVCLLYTSPSPRDRQKSRMPSSA